MYSPVRAQRLFSAQILKEDDNNWPMPDRVGRQELEIVMGSEHISFTTTKLGSLLQVIWMCDACPSPHHWSDQPCQASASPLCTTTIAATADFGALQCAGAAKPGSRRAAYVLLPGAGEATEVFLTVAVLYAGTIFIIFLLCELNLSISLSWLTATCALLAGSEVFCILCNVIALQDSASWVIAFSNCLPCVIVRLRQQCKCTIQISHVIMLSLNVHCPHHTYEKSQIVCNIDITASACLSRPYFPCSLNRALACSGASLPWPANPVATVRVSIASLPTLIPRIRLAFSHRARALPQSPACGLPLAEVAARAFLQVQLLLQLTCQSLIALQLSCWTCTATSRSHAVCNTQLQPTAS